MPADVLPLQLTRPQAIIQMSARERRYRFSEPPYLVAIPTAALTECGLFCGSPRLAPRAAERHGEISFGRTRHPRQSPH
jgi:hypothetical protein